MYTAQVTSNKHQAEKRRRSKKAKKKKTNDQQEETRESDQLLLPVQRAKAVQPGVAVYVAIGVTGSTLAQARSVEVVRGRIVSGGVAQPGTSQRSVTDVPERSTERIETDKKSSDAMLRVAKTMGGGGNRNRASHLAQIRACMP